MRVPRLPNPTLLITPTLALLFMVCACGRKGDPIPRPSAEPASCTVTWDTLRLLRVTLPTHDVRRNELLGIQSLRVYHLPLGAGRPTPLEILQRGDVMLERSRPDLPRPGAQVLLDLRERTRGPGWIVVVAIRVGGVVGVPSETLPWLHPNVK